MESNIGNFLIPSKAHPVNLDRVSGASEVAFLDLFALLKNVLLHVRLVRQWLALLEQRLNEPASLHFGDRNGCFEEKRQVN